MGKKWNEQIWNLANFGMNKICKDKKIRMCKIGRSQKWNVWLIRSTNTGSWVGGQKRL